MKNNWLSISDKALDNLFRNALKRSKIPFDEIAWIKMKIKLNNYSYNQQQISEI
ncbi:MULTISPECIES: hypothetical protein [unclassified Arcicella]|uniref:hypothetical protein n=1 Tax=unclassified Arcicella TaxID=2644986 RepID=UPI002858F3EF|nr:MULTISPECIES: hypothetical protein [unclassified Arcicella]MDR6563719.1 hypothetical protein [Arcicella sp. BE51]MDR6813597.1 hypothetical protein [Arcicella sp. BE140]MDR6824909.1 hypothetical protein [Arcicella sp. BE139]